MNELLALQALAGIHFMGGGIGLQIPEARAGIRMALDGMLACDAQPGLVTQSNAGIPAFLTQYIDPKLIEVLLAPMRAAEIAGGETKKGDWVTDTATFPMIEPTGEVNTYGDYSNLGVAGANINWTNRQSYHYQVITQWGEKELARAGLAGVDWANRLNMASIQALNRFQNKTYFFGVTGLLNYGLLNDPNLYTPITPANVGGNVTWAAKDAAGVFSDVILLFGQLQAQSNGLVDADTPMTLAMSPGAQVNLSKTNGFGINVGDLLKKNFPNLVVKTAPEYATASGNLVQLIANELDGQRTVEPAFTEKLRAHPVVVDVSSFKQKKSQGTWGSIIYRPFLIAQMLGV